MIFRAEQLRDSYYLLKMIPRPKFDFKKKGEEKKQAEEEMNLDGEEEEEGEE